MYQLILICSLALSPSPLLTASLPFVFFLIMHLFHIQVSFRTCFLLSWELQFMLGLDDGWAVRCQRDDPVGLRSVALRRDLLPIFPDWVCKPSGVHSSSLYLPSLFVLLFFLPRMLTIELWGCTSAIRHLTTEIAVPRCDNLGLNSLYAVGVKYLKHLSANYISMT